MFYDKKSYNKMFQGEYILGDNAFYIETRHPTDQHLTDKASFKDTVSRDLLLLI